MSFSIDSDTTLCHTRLMEDKIILAQVKHCWLQYP